MSTNTEISILDEENRLKIFIFWLKIIIGITGGIVHYLIQRILYETVFIVIEGLLRAILVVISIIGFLFFLHILIYSIIYLTNHYFIKEKQVKINYWRLTLRFSFMFLTIFVLSASLTYYIGI